MQFDRIAFADCLSTVLVHCGQFAVCISVGTFLVNAVGCKVKRECTVRIERHCCAAVIGGDYNTLCCRGGRFFRRLFGGFFHWFLIARNLICRNGHVTVQRPDCFRYRLQNNRILCRIILAVRHLVLAELVTCRTAHLAGVSI